VDEPEGLRLELWAGEAASGAASLAARRRRRCKEPLTISVAITEALPDCWRFDSRASGAGAQLGATQNGLCASASRAQSCCIDTLDTHPFGPPACRSQGIFYVCGRIEEVPDSDTLAVCRFANKCSAAEVYDGDQSELFSTTQIVFTVTVLLPLSMC
jgi:hypothetical protein